VPRPQSHAAKLKSFYSFILQSLWKFFDLMYGQE
jgi:hypothetical protein